MLDFMDRRPPELAPAPRVALIAVRLWAAEMRRDRCPLDLMSGLFNRFGAADALWPAHACMYRVAANARRRIDLGCPCCGRVSDDEAAILSALFAAEAHTAAAALRPLVIAEAVSGAARLAQSFGAELRAAQLAPRRA